VDYTSTTSNETKRKEVQAPTQYLEIEGLEHNTNYTITVMASTSKGYGPASEPIFVATDQDSKSTSALTCINACTRKVIYFLSYETLDRDTNTAICLQGV